MPLGHPKFESTRICREFISPSMLDFSIFGYFGPQSVQNINPSPGDKAMALGESRSSQTITFLK